MCGKLGHAKFQQSTTKRTFSSWGLNEGGGRVGKMGVFNRKVAISRKWWEIRPRLLLITNSKWHTLCQIRRKSLTLDDFEGHWQPVLVTAFSLDWNWFMCTVHCIVICVWHHRHYRMSRKS